MQEHPQKKLPESINLPQIQPFLSRHHRKSGTEKGKATPSERGVPGIILGKGGARSIGLGCKSLKIGIVWLEKIPFPIIGMIFFFPDIPGSLAKPSVREKPLENKESTGDSHGMGKLWIMTPSELPSAERETTPTFHGKAAPQSAAHPKKSIWIQI